MKFILAIALAVVTDPPMVVMLDRPGVAIAPDGTEIALPAGTRIDGCAAEDDGDTIDYDIDNKVIRVLRPCRDPSVVFRDGFEP